MVDKRVKGSWGRRVFAVLKDLCLHERIVAHVRICLTRVRVRNASNFSFFSRDGAFSAKCETLVFRPQIEDCCQLFKKRKFWESVEQEKVGVVVNFYCFCSSCCPRMVANADKASRGITGETNVNEDGL